MFGLGVPEILVVFILAISTYFFFSRYFKISRDIEELKNTTKAIKDLLDEKTNEPILYQTKYAS